MRCFVSIRLAGLEKKKKVNKMQLDVSVNRIKWTVKCHIPHHLPRHHLQPEKSACS